MELVIKSKNTPKGLDGRGTFGPTLSLNGLTVMGVSSEDQFRVSYLGMKVLYYTIVHTICY